MDFIHLEDINALARRISETRKPVVVAHTHPDGDALGASTGLALYLRSLGKEVAVVLPDTPAENLRFILDEHIPYLFHDASPADAEARIQEADLIILADANAFVRTEALEPFLKASEAPKVLMDHHLNPDSASFGLVFSTPDISSASEVVFWVLKALKPEAPCEKAIGTALLTGMTTDTNNFANSVFPSTFRMASELIAAGVDRDALIGKIYQSYRENRVRLMGYMQSQELRILGNGTAYMILSQEIQHRFDIRDGETEGLVNIPLTIEKVRLSVLLKEDGSHFRVSIRSKKGTSAQQLAQRCFHGGGHENAAGGKLLIGQDIPSADAAASFLETVLQENVK